MARLIQAMQEYGPRLELEPTVGMEEIAEWMMERNHVLRWSVIMVMLIEIGEAIAHFNRRGIPVKLEWVGTFTPSINRNGAIKHGYRADAKLKQRSNEAGAYTGEIINKKHIGLDNAGYKELWDADHPDDPLEA